MMVSGSVVSREALAGAASVLNRVPVTTTVSGALMLCAPLATVPAITAASAVHPSNTDFLKFFDSGILPLIFERKRLCGRKPAAVVTLKLAMARSQTRAETHRTVQRSEFDLLDSPRPRLNARP